MWFYVLLRGKIHKTEALVSVVAMGVGPEIHLDLSSAPYYRA